MSDLQDGLFVEALSVATQGGKKREGGLEGGRESAAEEWVEPGPRKQG